MKCYHGTTRENWEKIQKEGVLWGVTEAYTDGKKHVGPRYTYLSPEIEVAEAINSEVILEVDYKPTGIRGIDNYGFDPPPGQTCWQFSVFIPISIDKVKIFKIAHQLLS